MLRWRRWSRRLFFESIAAQMSHAKWGAGFTFEDIIFPLFLFIAGISFPFSLEKQRERGMSEAAIYKKIIRRGITLVVLGFVYNGLLNLNFETQRYASVLARIGLGWMFGALIFVNTRTITRVWIVAAILIRLLVAVIYSGTRRERGGVVYPRRESGLLYRPSVIAGAFAWRQL